MTVRSLLDLTTLVSRLGPMARRFDVDVLARCDSSNSALLRRAEARAPSGTVVVAREQTAGRGRRGREWISSPESSLMFSLLWRFLPGVVMSGLSLAVGLAVVEALSHSGRASAAFALKWPNDVLSNGKKVGGILIELVPGDANAAVIGIGLNLSLPTHLPQDVRAASAGLDSDIDANELLADLLLRLAATLDVFAAKGFAGLRTDWLRLHAFQNQAVTLNSDFAGPRKGICRGVDEDGALLLEHDGRIERIISGEVSLRLAS